MNVSRWGSAFVFTSGQPRRLILRKFLFLLTAAALGPAQVPAVVPFSDLDFKSLVRESDPLPVEESLKAFDVPDGFVMELVAASPDIGQPMNLAFDERGRLWVSSTLEYPYPAPPNRKGRDTIKVFEDTNGDGRYDKITTFADCLNIPTGLHPYKDGVIAWSIPNIWNLQDTNGDGRADTRTRLFGPLGYERDTHGMHSSFTRGLDGWLHITHGFNNTTTLNATDGSSIQMNSGNTYRVQLDGSSVQQFTFGQVNPFGMCLDALGNFYTADCHSSPIYQLIRGSYYPSFGKPHDGTGFAPLVIRHNHDSTGLCGIVFNQSSHWPQEFRDNIFVGNVITSRVNRDKINWHGSSPKGVEKPDLIRTRDPWFRPVDLQFGTDGALYIADFYNRIIGHYEVRLDHPGRDREMGRIWRLVYNGPEAKHLAKPVDLTQAKLRTAINELSSPLLARRMTATEYLVDDIGTPAVEPLGQAIVKSNASSELKAHGAWALHRLAKLDEPTLLRLAKDKKTLVRSHSRRIAGAQKTWTPTVHKMVLTGLEDESPHVRRAAADALALRPHAENIRPLLRALDSVPERDEHLQHALRIALRNNFRSAERLADFDDLKSNKAALRHLMRVALAVESPFAGELLLANLETAELGINEMAKTLRHIARNTPQGGLERLAAVVQKQFAADIDVQAELLLEINEGLVQRGLTAEKAVLHWARELAQKLLASAKSVETHWRSEPVKGTPPSALPWIVESRGVQPKASKWENHPHPEHPTRSPWLPQARNSNDGKRNERYATSLPPGGESLTGILRSAPFSMPDELRFFLCGHRGFPNDPAHDKNYVRLLDASTGAELQRAYPPRNDTGVSVRWKGDTGQSVYLEVVDGDTGGAFAWLGIARLNVDLEIFAERKIISSLRPGGERLTGIFRSTDFDIPAKLAFTIIGHSGNPDRPVNGKNYFQLVDSISGRVLKKTAPPRNDGGVEMEWDLREFAGRRVRLEIVDGDTNGSFAWLAVGGFEPNVAPIPEHDLQTITRRQTAVARVVHDLKLREVLISAESIAHNPAASTEARSLVAQALLANGTAPQQTKLGDLLMDETAPESLRLAIANNGTHLPAVQEFLLKALCQAPAELQVKLARALVQNQAGANRILTAVEKSQAPAGLLMDIHIRDRFPKDRVAALTKNTPKPSAEVERLIADRIAEYREKGGHAESGKKIYATYCATCHKRGNIGADIGPQLEGIGNRGVDRLVEDIIDPNRNIDVAFHYSIAALKDGRVITGLKRREVDQTVVFATIEGKEIVIQKSEIENQVKVKSPASIMPTGFGQAIPASDFRDLLEYLLTE